MYNPLLSENAPEDFSYFFQNMSKFLLPSFELDPEFLAAVCKQDFEQFISSNALSFPLAEPAQKLQSSETANKPVSIPSPSPLTAEERRLKIQKFLEKRQRRNFNRKVAYECRKKVADNRIRIKGRFVTKMEADALYGFQNEKNNCSLIKMKKK